jgi:protein-tyrosine-phosphatase
LSRECCGREPEKCVPAPTTKERAMSDKTYNVLFICTGNSARSIMAEAILSEVGQGKFRAYSAGVKPVKEPNQYVVDILTRLGHDTSGLRPKHISEFQTPDAPEMDFIIAVCDQTKVEKSACWSGQPMTAEWAVKNPLKYKGTDAQIGQNYHDIYAQLLHRIQAFTALPLATLDKMSLHAQITAIGDA